MASAQLPQSTRSQAGKPEEFEFQPQPHGVSLSGQSLHCSGPGHPQQGVLTAHILFSPAFDQAFDHLLLIKAILNFKMQKAL